jgi:hypothetical protein
MISQMLFGFLILFWFRSDPYQTFIKQISAGEMPGNWTEVRFACTMSEHCDPAASMKRNSKFDEAMKAGKYDDAVKIAEKAVHAGVVDLRAHEMCAEAYDKSGDKDKASFHRRVHAALLSSFGGDGRSETTAFQVFSIGEEYSLVHFLGLSRPCSQALANTKAHRFDILTCSDQRTNSRQKIFFQIDKMPY